MPQRSHSGLYNVKFSRYMHTSTSESLYKQSSMGGRNGRRGRSVIRERYDDADAQCMYTTDTAIAKPQRFDRYVVERSQHPPFFQPSQMLDMRMWTTIPSQTLSRRS